MQENTKRVVGRGANKESRIQMGKSKVTQTNLAHLMSSPGVDLGTKKSEAIIGFQMPEEPNKSDSLGK